MTGGLMAHPATAALNYWLVLYRRTWRTSVFSSFVIPLMWLTAIGLGVGSYIDRGSADLGVAYLSYLAPGLLASIVLQTGVEEMSWPVYSAIHWKKTYAPMLASPLRVGDIVLGHIGYVTFRMTITAGFFFVTMAVFGTLHSAWAPLALPAALLTGLATATPVYAFTAAVRQENRLPLLFRFVVVPLTLFSGVFFPVDGLPAVVRPLAWLSPLWHGVELCRAATLGTGAPLWPVLHVGYLAVWAVVGFVLVRTILTRKLVV